MILKFLTNAGCTIFAEKSFEKKEIAQVDKVLYSNIFEKTFFVVLVSGNGRKFPVFNHCDAPELCVRVYAYCEYNVM